VYHTNTYGHLVGGIVQRATGEMPGTRLRRITAALDAHVHWGLTSDEQARCADVIWAPTHAMGGIDPFTIDGDGHLPMLSYFNPPGYSSNGVVNTARVAGRAGAVHQWPRDWRRAGAPVCRDHRADAVAVAGAAGGGLTRAVVEGPCPVLGEDVSFGLGFTPTSARRPLGPNPRSFGHFGTGGALGFADPDSGVAFGYVMNHVIPRWQSTRNRALIDAVFECV
jgi:CubicO group peptidase (beta-lactamase class C family)